MDQTLPDKEYSILVIRNKDGFQASVSILAGAAEKLAFKIGDSGLVLRAQEEDGTIKEGIAPFRPKLLRSEDFKLINNGTDITA